MGFFDAFTFSMLMAFRDWSRDNERQKEKRAQFYQQCIEEITDIASDMFQVISSVAKEANPNFVSDEIIEGVIMLPIYGFYKVLQNQCVPPTKEQQGMLDIYFKTMPFPFTKNEFIAAACSENSARQYMEDLVGISVTRVGRFWRLFFKLLYITESEEETLDKVTYKFSDIVFRFEILGKQEDIALPICNEFVEAVYEQIKQCRNLPEETVDFIGEVPFDEHLRKMKDISMDLARAAGEDEDKIVELLDFFCVGLLYSIAIQTTRNDRDKEKILNRALELSGIDIGIDGHRIMEEMKDEDGVVRFINELIDYGDIDSGNNFTGYWGILIGIGQEVGREEGFFEFLFECIGYLTGIENVLSREFPYSGLGMLSRKYVLGIIRKANVS